MQILDTLGIIDKDVGPIDGVDFPHQILVHAQFGKFVSNLLGVLCSYSAISEFACSELLNNYIRERFYLNVESVVPVRRLTLEWATCVCTLNRFPVYDYWLAYLDFDSLFFLKAVDCDFEMEFPHPCQQSLASFLVGRNIK